MDKFFDRLGDILNSLLNSGGKTSYPIDSESKDAWDELNAYLDGEENPVNSSHEQAKEERSYQDWFHSQDIRTDYANLEVPFGAPFSEVKKNYKRLLKNYHPDKNALNPEKLRIATEITKKINRSYQKIKNFEKNRS